jgi:protein-tyrosine phosphatase
MSAAGGRNTNVRAVIDLHCHILPGIDDGPPTMAESVALARAAVAAGTRTIVATPHVTRDHPGNTAARIAEGVTEVNAALEQEGVALEVLPGAEIAMTRAAELPEDELRALRLGGGPYLLVECPLSPAAVGFEPIATRLADRGHRILLAHPERCPAFQRAPAGYEALIAQGMLGQVTAGALVGRFGRHVQAFAHRLLREGLAHDVSSDGHSAVHRPPSIRPELVAAGYGEQADWLARQVPEAVLSGAPVPVAPPMPRTAGRVARLLRRAS